jgi:beta propeller repeat protein
MRDLISRGTAVAIVMVMVLGSMLFLLENEKAEGQERDNEEKISWGAYRQRAPAIYGNRITWDSYGTEMYVYDVNTEEIRMVTSGADASYPDIYGDYIVYQDNRLDNLNHDIYHLDMKTGIEYRMYDGSDRQYNPRIWGEDMVWYEKDGDYWYIAVGRARTDLYFYIGWGAHNQTNPDIWGRSVVYEDDINGNQDIYFWDRSDREEIQITTDEANQRDPRIYGTKIVWTDYRNVHTDIYMYDLMTKTETRITNDPSDQRYPVIHDDIIVWQDYRNGNWDIYMMDLKDGVPIQVTTNESNQSKPDIYGDIIVWHDQRPEPAEGSGGLNIFMTHIDQDDDGIYDWDDPHPTIPHFSLDSLEYKMDMLMIQLKLTELNLTTRLQALELEMRRGFVELTEDMIEEVGMGVGAILEDLEAHDNTLWGTNNTMRMEFVALNDELTSMRENITIDEEKGMALIKVYIEKVEKLIGEVRTSIELSISELALELEDNMDSTSENLSANLEEIYISLEELQKLDEIVTDLETVSRDVEKVESNTEDEGMGFFEIVVIILMVLILFMVFISMFTKRKVEDPGDIEW